MAADHAIPLQHGGGGGTWDGMDAEAIINAKVAAAEARVDTKFAELRADLSHLPTKGTIWGAIGTAIVAILGVILAMLSYGGDRFDSGVSLADHRQSQMQRDADQDRAVANINSKIDQLIAAQKATSKK